MKLKVDDGSVHGSNKKEKSDDSPGLFIELYVFGKADCPEVREKRQIVHPRPLFTFWFYELKISYNPGWPCTYLLPHFPSTTVANCCMLFQNFIGSFNQLN